MPAAAGQGNWFSKLTSAIRQSRRALEPFRENRLAAIRQYVGNHYSNDGTKEKVPVPLLAMSIRIFLRHLVARRPAALITSQRPELKPVCYRLEVALNRLLDEINLGHTLELAALDAMFSVGFMKIGLEPIGQVEINGSSHDVGQPFVDTVDLDDMVWDVAAKSFERCAYVGDRYRLPLSYVKESGLYEGAADLTASVRGLNEGEGNRAEDISRGTVTEDGEYEPTIDLWDIYMPRENVMLTFPVEGETGPILRQVEWSGPEAGPYRRLGYGDVPAQINPLAPVALWMDIHTLANALYRKLGRQGERQKDNLGYGAASAKDAQRLQESSDGEVFRMDNPQGLTQFKSGGIDPQNLAFFIHSRDLYSWVAGNLDSLGGLSPQSETLGQDEMLAASSSKTLEDLQDRTLNCSKELLDSLAWFLWYDPLIEVFMTKRIEGADIEVPMLYSPETREGDFLDYNISIEPCSMQYRAPAQRLMMLRQIWAQDIIPILPLLQAQGVMPEVEKYLRSLAKYSNMPEIAELVSFTTPSLAEQHQAIGNPMRQSPVTRRENVRINRSAGTRMGKDAAFAQTLMGAGVQGAEARAATKPGL